MKEITKQNECYKEAMDWVFAEGVPIWDRMGVKRVVSMAACIVGGHLIVGNRHFCPIMRMTMDNLGIEPQEEDHEADHQGFVDQWGVYMTRQEAWSVAKAAGQIKNVFSEGILFSECYL